MTLYQPFISALYWNRASTYTRPLTSKSPNSQVILEFLISWQVVNYLQSHTLSISNNYLLAFISNFICKSLAIIYKLVIIFQGWCVIVTTPINKDLQLPLHPISIRFSRSTLEHKPHTFIHTHLRRTHSHLLIYLFSDTLLTHVLNWASKLFVLQVPPLVFLIKATLSSTCEVKSSP